MLISAVPMLIIANAYRRLNMWNANAGASFEWVGRSINPYLGFFTGWLMIAGYVLGTLSGVEVLGPSVLAIFNASETKFADVAIATAIGVIMTAIAVVGIRITARTQVVMAVVEYTILVGMSIWGLVFVLGHHAGTVPVTSGWFSPTGIGGNGDLVGGFLIAVFAYSGWDGTIYVNEEVKHRRVNPGRAALIAVALLAVIYTLAQVGLQGVVSSKNLAGQLDADALVYVAQALGGSGWAKVMAAVPRPVGDRDHRDRHRGRRPDRLRDGELPRAARVPQQRAAPLPDAGRRERRLRVRGGRGRPGST